MDFRLTEERQMLQDSLRRYLADTVTPDGIAAATDGEAGFDRTVWDGLVEMGVPAALFPEEQGGFGGAGFDLMVVFEELGRAGLPAPLLETVLVGSLASSEDLIAGQVATLAHAEPSSRYDLSHVETRAEQADGAYQLTGRKAVVPYASATETLLVSARLDDKIALFQVRPDAVQMRDYPLNGGGRASEIMLDGASAQLVQEDAMDALHTALARATAAQCAEALGLMEAIKALTVDYLRNRKQFGQPIGKFQALQHRMADVLIEIEQARSAVINLCGHLDGPERDLHVSATKNLIGRTAKLVVEESIQMHGGIGMTQEYALGHLAKRLTMVDHRFGDADHHLERFIQLAAA